MMATTFPGVRMTGASKKLMEDQAREVIGMQQNGNAVSYQDYQQDDDDDDNEAEFLSFQPKSESPQSASRTVICMITPIFRCDVREEGQ